jgi:hypothetical protein
MKGVFFMRRFTLLATIVAVSLSLLVSLSIAGDEIAALNLEKECVLFGRIANRNIMLYPASGSYSDSDFLPVAALPTMTELKGFEFLNNSNGELYPLDISDEGYFCANVGMGKYDLRGRDRNNEPYVIHKFSIPRGYAINLGTFWIDTHNPTVVSREGWASHLKAGAGGWLTYEEGSSAVALRFEHVADDDSYDECEEWFEDCHEEVYLAFEQVVVRR